MTKAYSVSELSNLLKACFENPAFSNIPVYGEVYSIKLGKFSYIELGDQGNKQTNSPLLKCAFSCYYGNDYGLEDIKVGDVIQIIGTLSYYPHGSSITLWGKSCEILRSQEGKNLLAKKKTLEKLDKLGLLDEKRKRKIPSYCKKVAILTAENGAAYQDILKTLHDRFPVSTVLYPIVVQGSDAARTIVHAMTLCQDKDYDCILLGRGGGSKTDLSCFDDEKVALAIAYSKVPVITCIGHTIDTAIADRVSDIKAITPTEGAALINPSLDDVQAFQENFRLTLDATMKVMIKNYALALDAYQQKLEALSPINKVKSSKEKLKHVLTQLDTLYLNHLKEKKFELTSFENHLKNSIESKIQASHLKWQRFKSSLELLNPQALADKGYALIYKNGEKVKSAKQLNLNDQIEITYVDGRIKAEVKE